MLSKNFAWLEKCNRYHSNLFDTVDIASIKNAIIYASLSNSQLTQGSLDIKFLDLNSFKATVPTAVTHAAAPLTAARIFGSSVYITKNKPMQLSLSIT